MYLIQSKTWFWQTDHGHLVFSLWNKRLRWLFWWHAGIWSLRNSFPHSLNILPFLAPRCRCDVIYVEEDIKVSHSGQTSSHLHKVLVGESIKSILTCLGLCPNNAQDCLKRISFEIYKKRSYEMRYSIK